MRPIPSETDVVEAFGIVIGPISTGTPFNLDTEERAATVLLDYASAQVLNGPPPPAAPTTIADIKKAHLGGGLSGILKNINWLQVIQLILGLLGGLGGTPAPVP